MRQEEKDRRRESAEDPSDRRDAYRLEALADKAKAIRRRMLELQVQGILAGSELAELEKTLRDLAERIRNRAERRVDATAPPASYLEREL